MHKTRLTQMSILRKKYSKTQLKPFKIVHHWCIDITVIKCNVIERVHSFVILSRLHITA